MAPEPRPEPRTAAGEIHSRDPNPPTHVADDSAAIKAIHTPGNDPTRLSAKTVIARLRALNDPKVNADLDAMEKAGGEIKFNLHDPHGKTNVDGYVGPLDPATGQLPNKNVYINFDRMLGFDPARNRVDLTRDPVKVGSTTGIHEVTHTSQDFTKGYNRGHEFEARKSQRLVDPESVPKSDRELKAEIDRDYAHLPAPDGWFDDGHQNASPAKPGASSGRILSQSGQSDFDDAPTIVDPPRLPAIVLKGDGARPDGTFDPDRVVIASPDGPVYLSSGTSRTPGVGPNEAAVREAGQAYKCFGFQEGTSVFGPDGWVMKFKHLGSQTPIPGFLDRFTYSVEGVVTGPKAVNDWLESRGVRVYRHPFDIPGDVLYPDGPPGSKK